MTRPFASIGFEMGPGSERVELRLRSWPRAATACWPIVIPMVRGSTGWPTDNYLSR